MEKKPGKENGAVYRISLNLMHVSSPCPANDQRIRLNIILFFMLFEPKEIAIIQFQ